MTKLSHFLATCVFATCFGSVAVAQNVFGAAENFTDSELAISGLMVARSMVEADCKGRVFWAQSSAGKSGYAAGYAQLREEGYSKKEMRRASKHRTKWIQAFGMWLAEGGLGIAGSEVDSDQLCSYIEEIAGTNHPVGRFLVKG